MISSCINVRTILVTAFVCLMLSFQTIHAADIEYPQTRIMAATANHAGSVHVTALEKFAEILEQESKGNVTVTLFTGGSKGDELDNVKQLRTGELQVAAVATSDLAPFAPSATITVLPYLFPEIEKAYTLFENNNFITELGDRVAAESLTRPLGWMISDYRSLTNSKKPITRIADLQGLKIRVPEVPIQLELFRSWEVEPHPLAWSETVNALEQGVVDGQVNPHSVNRDQKLWEVQKYVTDLHHMLWVGPLLVSERWYQNLEPNLKALIDRAARKAVAHQWQWADEQNRLALQECLDNGMQITRLSDEHEWKARARALWPRFYRAVGGKENIDRALEIMNTP
ncbi:TRAP transporter substrate-binding protein [Desulfosediminicola ganghwensis]|uniref:TRAP transporter substrate-binding protein n=1 Tax=Desulfosediminicola ganghwensis TaxID=2569540 RepID=UPI0010AC7408|nr:TRAP transporter substrate-binding protein [Desulfosediminicola ganghwensis]